jgi:transposase
LGRTRKPTAPLQTIWEISDSLWARIEPILREDAPPTPKRHGGRPRIDWRAALNGIIFRMRSGCQWNKLPKHFGDDSSEPVKESWSCHRLNQRVQNSVS